MKKTLTNAFDFVESYLKERKNYLDRACLFYKWMELQNTEFAQRPD